MSSSTREPNVVRVSQKGQATIPKPLREKFGIDTPREVFIYEEGGRIVVEPIPPLSKNSVVSTLAKIATAER